MGPGRVWQVQVGFGWSRGPSGSVVGREGIGGSTGGKGCYPCQRELGWLKIGLSGEEGTNSTTPGVE